MTTGSRAWYIPCSMSRTGQSTVEAMIVLSLVLLALVAWGASDIDRMQAFVGRVMEPIILLMGYAA